eukprot:gene151-966_t
MDIGVIPDYCRQRILDCLPSHDKVIFAHLCKDAARHMDVHLRFGSVEEGEAAERFSKTQQLAGAAISIQKRGANVLSFCIADDLTIDYDEYFERSVPKLDFSWLEFLPNLQNLEVTGRFAGCFCGMSCGDIYKYGGKLKRLVLCLESHHKKRIRLNLHLLSLGCPELKILHVSNHTEWCRFDITGSRTPDFKNLENLWIGNSRFVYSHLKGCPELRQLRLPVFYEQSKTANFSLIARLQKLESLAFDMCEGGYPQDLSFLHEVKTLKYFCISESDLHIEPEYHTHLQHAEFSDTALQAFVADCAGGTNPFGREFEGN